MKPLNKRTLFFILSILLILCIVISILIIVITKKKKEVEIDVEIEAEIENKINYSKMIEDNIKTLNEHYKAMQNKSSLDNSNIVANKLNGIDIYFINLNRSKDRLESISKQVSFYNIPNVTRIEGVDGKKLENKVNGIYIFSNGEEVTFINDWPTITKAEIGCTLSHLTAIQKAYDDGLDRVLIIEDGTYLGLIPFWEKSLDNIISEAPIDWEIINLYTSGLYGNCKNNSNTYIQHNKLDPCHGTVAYIINRKGMEKILKKVYHSNTFYIIKKYGRKLGVADYYIYDLVDYCFVFNEIIFLQHNIFLESTIRPFAMDTITTINITNKLLDEFVSNLKIPISKIINQNIGNTINLDEFKDDNL